jgi:predicted acetyltransferase
MNHTNPVLIPALRKDYLTIQRMFLFYVYDMGRSCGFNPGWKCPIDLDFEVDDLSPYFKEATRKAFLIQVENTVAGFALLHQTGDVWHVDEFFVHGKFQQQGIGKKIAHQLWEQYPACWELSVIPENKSALFFWRDAIASFTQGRYAEEIKTIQQQGKPSKQRILFNFDTRLKT